MLELEKTYTPKEIEEKILHLWETHQSFQFVEKKDKPPFTILMPPPNVTGSLHIGHALTFTLQDILVRYKRMQGFEVLWQPGMDHAGITTQMVVERLIESQGLKRKEMGREAFLNRVWQWKEESGGMILKQQRALGYTADWSLERFTMDQKACDVVVKVFVQLYRDGLIYKDNRLVNWDPTIQSAVSDLEVNAVETKGSLWHITYPLAEGDGAIVVATTRPETLFGDVAVAVHPDDERYHHLIGRYVKLPLTDRTIPIIADTYCNPEKGSGAVKITPAHDFNDFEVGKRHQLPLINIFDATAHLNENVPNAYQGLERFEARKRVIADLEAAELMAQIEPTMQSIPHAERSNAVIEPRLTEQWYVDAKTLAEPALRAVKEGRTQFVPENWANTYFNWLENIQPWCISRQLWWGHQIPAWYGPDQKVFVAHTEHEAHQLAHDHYGEAVHLVRDEDVLDTWFSSGLWPFLTLDWPDESERLKKHYPSSVLITGNDIIFFWVARMMMMSLKFMNDVPFKTVFIHALVRDEKGQKMSKSKGNVVDPLKLVDLYGADAVRFTVAALTTPGRDVRFSEQTVQNYRNFATKLWNATRFCLSNACTFDPHFDPETTRSPFARWIISETALLSQTLNNALERYRYDEAAQTLYQFVWGKFCDWFIEFAKPIFYGQEDDLKSEIQQTAAWVLAQIYHFLNPFMPFITEELWRVLSNQETPLITARWPFSTVDDLSSFVDPEAMREIEWLIRLITEIRASRSILNVSPGISLPLYVNDASELTHQRLHRYKTLIERMSHVQSTDQSLGSHTTGIIQCIVDEAVFLMPVGDILDVEKEKERLSEELRKLQADSESVLKKLNNPEFSSKAPQEILEKNKSRLHDNQEREAALTRAITKLG